MFTGDQMRRMSILDFGRTDICGCFVLGNPILPVWRGEIQCRALGLKVEVFGEKRSLGDTAKGRARLHSPVPSLPVGF